MRRTYLRVGLIFLGASVLIGAVVGAIWAKIAPGRQYQIFSNQTWAPLPTESLHKFTAFGIFAATGLVIGLMTAAAAWHFRELRGPLMLLISGLCAAAGTLVAGVVGGWLVSGVDPSSAALSGVQEIVTAPAVLDGWPAYLAAPTGAIVAYTFLVAWNGLPNLGRARN